MGNEDKDSKYFENQLKEIKTTTITWNEDNPSPGDSPNDSPTYKLVRLARNFRGVAMKNADAHIVISGCISRNSFLGNSPYQVIDRMVNWVNAKRDVLTAFGVWEKSIYGYVPLQPAPIVQDILILNANLTRPTPQYRGMKVVPPQDPVTQNDEDDGPVSGGVVVDAFAEPSKLVVTKVEAELFDGKNLRLAPLKMKLTLEVGTDGLKEVGGELTVFKRKLMERYLLGGAAAVNLEVTLGAKLQLEQNAAKALVGKWGGEFKSSLELEWKIPKTSLKGHVGFGLGVDTDGKPVKELQVGVDF
jgi:hypothetical protein